ncbi:hypothetical protein CRP403_gp22 [Roseobacter phage CRP-403]|uniref:Uncharacterized protein n=1 Tax=Roseobacter phage CRP-403 TaxID=3072849 RepID=A0AAX3ZX21_9CAUD|nr:hypothetical protein CRP403_gp22 [Roseobacter phage CRP-403]
MFLDFLKPKMVWDSSGGGSSGGGGGGGNDNSSSKPKPKPKPKPKVADKSGTDAGNGMVWKKNEGGYYTRVKAPKAETTTAKTTTTPKKASTSTANAYKQMATTMTQAGIMNVGGKQTPAEPAKVGNQPIKQTSVKNGKVTSKIVGALDPKKPVSVSKNADGSVYVPYDGKDAHNPNARTKNNPTGKTVFKNTLPDNENNIKNSKQTAAQVEAVSAPVKQSSGSSSPVTAPEKIDAQDGVGGGGRDGGKSGKQKASKVDEDKLKVQRQAQGVDRYKRTQTNAIKAAGERRRKNAMKIQRA